MSVGNDTLLDSKNVVFITVGDTLRSTFSLTATPKDHLSTFRDTTLRGEGQVACDREHLGCGLSGQESKAQYDRDAEKLFHVS